MISSLPALLTGIVDYAGLFPPAKLEMAAAVQAYAEYLRDPNRFMLGRFVVPVTRLPEFEEAAATLLPSRDEMPWRLSALTGIDLTADAELAARFNDRHGAGSSYGRAVIDVLEIKASTIPEIASALSWLPEDFQPYFELPIGEDPEPFIAELHRGRGRAKMRTGGVAADAFPSPEQVARFIIRCRDRAVPFKATAGLHHPIRAEYRLTYEPNPPRGVMYGYLNIFLAAAAAHSGAELEEVLQVLTETDPTAFVFTDDGVQYGDRILSLNELRKTRATFAIAFGSCSFREPVDDLQTLGISLNSYAIP